MRAHTGTLGPLGTLETMLGGIAFLASLTTVTAAGDLRLVEAVKSRNAAAVRALLQQHADVSLTFAPAARRTFADSTSPCRAANSSGVKPPRSM